MCEETPVITFSGFPVKNVLAMKWALMPLFPEGLDLEITVESDDVCVCLSGDKATEKISAISAALGGDNELSVVASLVPSTCTECKGPEKEKKPETGAFERIIKILDNIEDGKVI